MGMKSSIIYIGGRKQIGSVWILL